MIEHSLETDPSLSGHFRIMARNNRWSNYRLLNACEQLTQEEFTAPRISFFPSLWLTLNHLLIVDWYYVDALEKGGLGYSAFDNETPCLTVADLQIAQKQVDERLILFCDQLSGSDLPSLISFDRRDRGIFWDRVDRTLSHLFVHQIHHRGQVHAMLAGTVIRPPQLDEFFMDGDASLRDQDLVALGFKETNSNFEQ